ncbi:MAG: HAD family hydrolase [Chloroflexi bacterium]|nr:HAD family hydrolase [Chloroflexota bacterium]
MPIKTVVFDLGGTLIEYAGEYANWPDLETPGFQAAYNSLDHNGATLPEFSLFQDAGFTLLPEMWQAATRHEQNLTVTDLLSFTLQQVGVRTVSREHTAAAAHEYGRAIQAQARLIDTAVETVQQIKAAGYKVGLVSNTMFPGDMHRADMTRFGLIDYFDALAFSADLFQWKPNAAPFLHMLAKLEAEAETAVYIGDDPASDVVGGQAAGLRTIYFRSSQRFAPPDGVQPHAEIKRLKELLPLLQHWNGQLSGCH